MSDSGQTPREAFLALSQNGVLFFPSAPPDLDAVRQLRTIAANWSAAGQHTYAGYVLELAIRHAWGSGDYVRECAVDSLQEFERAVADAGSTDIDGVAALQMWITGRGMNYEGADRSDVRTSLDGLEEELAQRLVALAEATQDPTEHAGYLVRGFLLSTDFAGSWSLDFPAFEVDQSVRVGGASNLTLHMPSAFRVFIGVSDYEAANMAAAAAPEAFDAPSLRGWRAAIAGFLTPNRAVEFFTQAGEEFERDIYDERLRRTGHWSSINLDLWSKYFRARAAVAGITKSPERTIELLRQAAAALEGTEAGWTNPQVTCFRILVNAINGILEGAADERAQRAKEGLLRAARYSGMDENDRLALDFLDAAAAAFTEISESPRDAMVSGRLARALDILGRIRLIGDDMAVAVRPAIGERAHQQILGPQRTWIYRTIESIKDETKLQQILLRLMQARLPLYAQVRHGPLEYGKDIVALVEGGGRFRLEMYQVKAGDITTPVWRKARDELEEMFLVDLSGVQLPVEPDDREGILIFNGHVGMHVEPVVDGWLRKQSENHNRSFRLMHLDQIVTWIMQYGLTNELRSALSEVGVAIVGGP